MDTTSSRDFVGADASFDGTAISDTGATRARCRCSSCDGVVIGDCATADAGVDGTQVTDAIGETRSTDTVVAATGVDVPEAVVVDAGTVRSPSSSHNGVVVGTGVNSAGVDDAMDGTSSRTFSATCDTVVASTSIDGATSVVDASRDTITVSCNGVVANASVDSTVITDAGASNPPPSDGVVASASVDSAAVDLDAVATTYRCIFNSCNVVVTVTGVDSARVVDARCTPSGNSPNDIPTAAGEDSASVVDAAPALSRDPVIIGAGATGVDGARVVDAVAATKTTTLDSVVAAAGPEGAAAVEADAADTRSCRRSSSNAVVAG
ncbi:hypothetical protein MiTs_02476 [Microcystis aeruginosa NIES-2521]|uniref:Uncharacterized protein n=1 Tax=Microcystis aeruginosa NIES-2521 TaxID=2303983 RepID=A0A5A5RZI1_MICAE|nr:hypothetical protein MiTs_02476 [Microcystis aeruginosa NIES-2521]